MEGYLRDVTERLVAADTVSHRPSASTVAWLAEELERHGFRCRIQTAADDPGKANLVAWAGPPEAGGLALSGHVDVVPFEGQPGWTREPLRLSLDGDRAYGRGSSDMKGFVALCLDAARRLDPERLERPLFFLFTSDEEIGCLGAARLAPALATLCDEAPAPKLCWIGEPTSWQVFASHKGIVELDVEVRGRGGHSGVPEAGVNAIALAARAVGCIGELQRELREASDAEARRDFPEAPYTTLNVGTIEGGTASNMIPERCRFRVSYRPLPGRDPLAPWRQLRERLAALEPREPGSPLAGSFEVSEPAVVPALREVRGSSLEQALAETLGARPAGGAPYCTDAGFLADAGVVSLIAGPGDLAQAHQPDESVSLAAIARGVELLPQVLERLCGARPRP